jgi:DNA-binding CsgD family transcriptional regulator
MQATADVPSDLISLIYATSTDASKWPDVCAALNRHAGAGILMFGHNLGANEGLGMIGGGFDPVELDRYQAYFADKNPWMHMDAVMPVGVVGVSDAALSKRELFRTEFYNDWLRHQDNVIGGPALICYRSGKRFVALAAACRARRYDETVPGVQRLLETLAPHITRAIEISTALHGAPGSASHLHDSPHGIIFVHRSGRIGFVNDTAEQLFSASNIARISPTRRLQASDEALQIYLDAGVSAMREADFNGLPTPLAVRTTPLPCVFHAHIFPAAAEPEFPGSVWSDPIAGAFVIAGARGLDLSSSFNELAMSFGATQAEARLAQALMGGSSLYEFADLHNLSRHTVRNQMRALLHKTGARNQMDFVNRMHAVSSPFRRGAHLPPNGG